MSWASPVRLRAARIVHSLRPETSPERGSESLERGNDLSGDGARRNTPKGAASSTPKHRRPRLIRNRARDKPRCRPGRCPAPCRRSGVTSEMVQPQHACETIRIHPTPAEEAVKSFNWEEE